MAQFPILATGAVAQYPARYIVSFRADVVRFFDGSEQRFRNSPGVLHQWIIALSQLSEQEMNTIEEFFLKNQGAAGTFAFTDPWSAQVYPNCSIVSDELDETSVGVLSGKTTVTIRENRT
ncbi:DUF2460 domain-containing protein [Nevskia soli]|jgi:phage-related protein|uniref:DUF2460 domain-containing protein n=1 Tax=Nevskia soli TaxID=418856 RepID=UPI0015D7CA57|nr:DUF2460 domain-containing protein [Nevskia soli]